MFVGINRPQGHPKKAVDSPATRKIWLFAQIVLLPAFSGPACTTTSSAKPETPASDPGRECIIAAQPPAELPANAPSSIEVKHLLVSHRQSNGIKQAERKREEACLLAEEALEQIEKNGDWQQAFERYADNGGSLQGDLGRIEAEDALPEFSNVAFSLEVNQLSYVVESPRGFHVILRTR